MSNHRTWLVSVYMLLVPWIFLAVAPEDTPRYAVSAIADSLKKNANAVIREEMIEYTYFSPELNVIHGHRVVTVLNRNGDRHAAFVQPYDVFRKINFLGGEILDGNGKIIRKIKPSDIEDYSGSAGYALFDDIRYKVYNPLIAVYPYTVVFEYEIKISGSFYFPRWMAFEAYNVSIERTGVKVNVSENYQLRYKEFNCSDPVQVSTSNGKKSFLWQSGNITAIIKEPYADDLIHYVQAVYTAPSEFIYGGYPGKMNTWDDFARWIGQLNNSRDVLPLNRVQEIRDLVNDLTDDREKVKKLYTYMQGKTRYFNISLGIGGYQPVEARVVDEVGYGDCKGLSNYMKALLKAVGIKSYYTLVRAGNDFTQIIADFPSNQFNHAMLCVPLKDDTIWLECTSQVIPFGFLGSFSSDRDVLLIQEDGGKLVRTPLYSLEENIQATWAKVIISPDGNGMAEVLTRFGGIQFDQVLPFLYSSITDQKDWLYNSLAIPDFQITRVVFRAETNNKPESVLNLSLQLNKYGSLSGKRMFFPLNLTNRFNDIPPRVRLNMGNIVLPVAFWDLDSLEYNLPEGFNMEYLPESSKIITPFGEFHCTYTYKEGKLLYSRQLKIFKGTYPVEQYLDFQRFYKDISVADKEQIILLKKEF